MSPIRNIIYQINITSPLYIIFTKHSTCKTYDLHSIIADNGNANDQQEQKYSSIAASEFQIFGMSNYVRLRLTRFVPISIFQFFANTLFLSKDIVEWSNKVLL